MRRLALIVGLICLFPLRLTGAVSLNQPPMEWLEPTTLEQQTALAARPDYQRFLESAPGPWSAEFDPVLMTPRAIHGSGLALFPADANQNGVEKGVLKFLDEHAALFGANRGDFVIDGLVLSRDLWVVVAVQRYKGIPVQGSHLSLSIKQGRLILIQGVSHRVEGVDVTPSLGKEEAVGAAGRALGLRIRKVGRQRDSDEARSVILPLRSPGAVEYRLAWEVTSRREGDQGFLVQNIVSHIDALNGDVLSAYDANRHDYSGTAAMEVERRTVGDPDILVPAPFLNLLLAGATTQSNAAGAFSVNALTYGSQSITSQLRGPLVRVTNAGGPNASFSGTIDENTSFSLLWDESNSDPSERMTYRAVVESNRFAAAVFPSLAWLNTPIPAAVNFNDVCNAFWDGVGIVLFRGGFECNATGRIFDIVAHEWGHGLDQAAPGGFVDVALSEFIGDLVAFVQTDDFLIAPGFFTGGSGHLRDLQSPFFECFDPLKTEVHDAGQLLGAVVWDIHEDLQAAGMNADDLRRLMLLPIATAQTRSEWYMGMLAVDDDDGNLANGTPHECAIYRQFNLHSCGADRWPGIPASGSTASPAVLWPANHNMVPVTITVTAAELCYTAAVCRVTSVESNEPVDGTGDGDTAPDWIIDGDKVLLRAERSGNGTGRIYTLHVECTDEFGNALTTTATVTVPHGKP